MGEDGICIHMNVSGKRQARYQMLTIYGLLEVNGDVLLDLQAPKWWNPNTAVVSQLYTLLCFIFVVFFPPPTVSVLPQQHITAYYACKFRTSKVVIFPVCLSVKPFALICCCVEYDLNIKTLYLDITLWGFFFAWYKIHSWNQMKWQWNCPKLPLWQRQ